MTPPIETEYAGTLEGAKLFLRAVLAEGTWVSATRVRSAAAGHGVSWTTVHRARNTMPIIVQKRGKQWMWHHE